VGLSKTGRNVGPQHTHILVTNLPEVTPRYVVFASQKRWAVAVCQTPPIKRAWCPLRLFCQTMRHLRGGFKRENALDIHRFACPDDFADPALGDGLTFCKRELFKGIPQQLAKGRGRVPDLLPMDALLPSLRSLPIFLRNLW